MNRQKGRKTWFAVIALGLVFLVLYLLTHLSITVVLGALNKPDEVTEYRLTVQYTDAKMDYFMIIDDPESVEYVTEILSDTQLVFLGPYSWIKGTNNTPLITLSVDIDEKIILNDTGYGYADAESQHYLSRDMKLAQLYEYLLQIPQRE